MSEEMKMWTDTLHAVHLQPPFAAAPHSLSSHPPSSLPDWHHRLKPVTDSILYSEYCTPAWQDRRTGRSGQARDSSSCKFKGIPTVLAVHRHSNESCCCKFIGMQILIALATVNHKHFNERCSYVCICCGKKALT